MKPLISICIPAYKNETFLNVLLKSIEVQSFINYEVIVSDDSPSDEVEILCQKFAEKFKLIYHKNQPAKGSPANWNTAIKMATGEWIKLMHDDDWFADGHSLQSFVDAAITNPDAGFIFSGYSNYDAGNVTKVSIPDSIIEKKLRRSPLSLFSENYIGHPSTTLVKNNLTEWYDEHTKWVVDFEFYIRCLKDSAFYIIQKPLINIGINNEQITKAVFGDKAVVIPENIYLLNKMGVSILKNIGVYDHYWRMFRNLNIRNVDEVKKYNGGNMPPNEIEKMLRFQVKVPLSILRIGFLSKPLMAVSYLFN